MLLTNLDSGVLTLTLNRPEKRNALSAPLLSALNAGLERADLDAAPARISAPALIWTSCWPRLTNR